MCCAFSRKRVRKIKVYLYLLSSNYDISVLCNHFIRLIRQRSCHSGQGPRNIKNANRPQNLFAFFHISRSRCTPYRTAAFYFASSLVSSSPYMLFMCSGIFVKGDCCAPFFLEAISSEKLLFSSPPQPLKSSTHIRPSTAIIPMRFTSAFLLSFMFSASQLLLPCGRRQCFLCFPAHCTSGAPS